MQRQRSRALFTVHHPAQLLGSLQLGLHWFLSTCVCVCVLWVLSIHPIKISRRPQHVELDLYIGSEPDWGTQLVLTKTNSPDPSGLSCQAAFSRTHFLHAAARLQAPSAVARKIMSFPFRPGSFFRAAAVSFPWSFTTGATAAHTGAGDPEPQSNSNSAFSRGAPITGARARGPNRLFIRN